MTHARQTTNVAFVPGFMQRADAWKPVAERVAARGWTTRYAETVEDAGGVVVAYSHGGRLAIRQVDRFDGLVLVGATPGIEDPDERAARRAADEELATWMETHSIDDVVARWEKQPVFATQDDELVRAQRPGRLDHDPRDLAAQLRATGQGVLPPVWDDLPRIEIPVLALAGAYDERYAKIARRMAERLPKGRAAIVENAGHAPQLERPEAVTELLLEFLDEHFGDRVVGDGDA